MMKAEVEFMLHDHDVRNQIDDIRNMIDSLTNSINDTIDDYMSLVKEGKDLGLMEDEIMEDYAGWVDEFENLKNFIEDNNLNI